MIPTGGSTLLSTLERTQYLRVCTTRERAHTSAHLLQNPPKKSENHEKPKKKSQYDTCMQDTTRGPLSHRAYSDSWMDGWTFQHSALSTHAFYPHGTAFSLLFSARYMSAMSHLHNTNMLYKTPKTFENHQNQKKKKIQPMHACKTRFAVHFSILRQTDGWIRYSGTQRSACMPFPLTLWGFPPFPSAVPRVRALSHVHLHQKHGWMDGWATQYLACDRSLWCFSPFFTEAFLRSFLRNSVSIVYSYLVCRVHNRKRERRCVICTVQ